MRGKNYEVLNESVAKAMLMSRYHQPYSEIEKMPLRTVLFLLRLAEAEDAKMKADMKKNKRKWRK